MEERMDKIVESLSRRNIEAEVRRDPLGTEMILNVGPQHPAKMADVVSKGRYIPTQTSIGLLTCKRISPTAISIPTIMSGQAISPPPIPFDNIAIKLA